MFILWLRRAFRRLLRQIVITGMLLAALSLTARFFPQTGVFIKKQLSFSTNVRSLCEWVKGTCLWLQNEVLTKWN